MHCRHCQSSNVYNYGRSRGEGRRVKCRDCSRTTTEIIRPRGRSEEDKNTAMRLYANKMSIRGIAKELKVSPTAVVNWIKKKPPCSVRSPSPKRESPVA